MKTIRFEASAKRTFHTELLKNVNSYFKENNISKHANMTMVVKTCTLLAMYFIPYLIILNVAMPVWSMWLLTVVIGVALAGIGMGVMHDSCHGAYSSKPLINNFLSYSMNLIGGNKYNWVIQHNIKHHTFTNIFHADEDLENGNVIRLSPYSEYKWFHKYQHIYCWLLYSLGTLSWVTIKDFKQFGQLFKEDNKKNGKGAFIAELAILIFTKILYYVYMVVIPYMLLDLSLGQVLVGFLTMHFVAGWILSITFQLAHVVENTEHSIANVPEVTEIEDSWAIHQIKTTANFARKNPLLNWYLGGLNFQVEHHLFPNICHVHYDKIAPIVKKAVEDNGYTYNEYPTMTNAVVSHYNALKLYSDENYKPTKSKSNQQPLDGALEVA
jgi:linoleoyl-CoA desaturase